VGLLIKYLVSGTWKWNGENVADLLGPEMGTFLHACEGEIVCESINTKIPYFNAPIYLQNKVRKLFRLTPAI
jgi:hypothetical protein